MKYYILKGVLKMVVLLVTTLDDLIFDQVVKISIHHSLNEEVVKNCGKSLPYPFILFLDGLLLGNHLRMWLKTNEEMYK